MAQVQTARALAALPAPRLSLRAVRLALPALAALKEILVLPVLKDLRALLAHRELRVTKALKEFKVLQA